MQKVLPTKSQTLTQQDLENITKKLNDGFSGMIDLAYKFAKELDKLLFSQDPEIIKLREELFKGVKDGKQ
jgi:arsenate reductase-like glutaredoxin family protein